MKYSLFPLFCIFWSFVFGQAPQGLNYQAVARDGNGNPLQNTTIQTHFSILKDSINGAMEYQETQTTTTNGFGLYTLTIGQGDPTFGNFNSIQWASGTKFLKVEVNNQLTGTTQLWSVPYSLFAEKSKSSNDWVNVGDSIIYSPKSFVGIGDDSIPNVQVEGHTVFRASSDKSYGNVVSLQLNRPEVNWNIGTGSNDFGGYKGLGFRVSNDGIGTNATTRMVINENGNVGIGISNPAEKLHVVDQIRVQSFPPDDQTPSNASLSLRNRGFGGNTYQWSLHTASVGGGFGVRPNAFELWEYPPGQGGGNECCRSLTCPRIGLHKK
jgi:hypothetical protein